MRRSRRGVRLTGRRRIDVATSIHPFSWLSNLPIAGWQMSTIVSAAIVTKVADFAAKVAMNLYVKWHFGGSHERAERYRAKLKEQEKAKNEADK